MMTRHCYHVTWRARRLRNYAVFIYECGIFRLHQRRTRITLLYIYTLTDASLYHKYVNKNKNMERTENVIVLGAGAMGGYANYGNHVHVVVHGGDVVVVLMVVVVVGIKVVDGAVYMLPGRG